MKLPYFVRINKAHYANGDTCYAYFTNKPTFIGVTAIPTFFFPRYKKPTLKAWLKFQLREIANWLEETE